MKKLREEMPECLDILLKQEVEDGKIPGSAVLIGDTEGNLYKKSFGAVKPDSIFCLCSMTKPITAVAALHLMDQGLLSPDEPVAKYLPSFEHAKIYRDGQLIPSSRAVRIRDLLNMTSGLLYPMDQMYGPDVSPVVWERLGETVKSIREQMDAGKKISCAEACDMLADAPLAFEPGTRWAYGMSADVLGGVVERVAKIPFRDYVKSVILDPLGMWDTDFFVPEDKLYRVADIMSQEAGSREIFAGIRGFPDDGRALSELPYVTSAGGGWLPFFGRGLYSTIEDYGRFARMLLNLGTVDGKSCLSLQTSKLFQRNHLSDAQKVSLWPELLDGYGYGNLMRVMIRPEDIQSNGNIGEFGWDGLLGTYFFVDVRAGIYFVYMQQGPVDFSVRHKMCRIVYSSLQ